MTNKSNSKCIENAHWEFVTCFNYNFIMLFSTVLVKASPDTKLLNTDGLYFVYINSQIEFTQGRSFSEYKRAFISRFRVQLQTTAIWYQLIGMRRSKCTSKELYWLHQSTRSPMWQILFESIGNSRGGWFWMLPFEPRAVDHLLRSFSLE